MAFNAQLATTPAYTDFPFHNYGVTAIAAETPVSVDATNVLGGVNAGVGVIPVAALGNPVIGIAMESIPAGGNGRVRCFGPICSGVADGTITAGGGIDASVTASRSVKAHTDGKSQVGLALSTALDGEPVLFMLGGSSVLDTASTTDAGLIGILDTAATITGTTVEAALAELSARLLQASASETAIKAIPAAARADGTLVVDLTNNVLWQFDAGSAASASAWVLVPDAGTGRWLRNQPSLADLAATTSGNGASLVGVLDTAAKITATTVEGALAELAAILFPLTRVQFVTGTLVGGTCTVTVGANQAVTALTKAFPTPAAVITGSTNFAQLAHLIASNVVGGSGVGQVIIRALGSDGAQDVDAAGTFHAFLVD